jgi:hypothetical protein
MHLSRKLFDIHTSPICYTHSRGFLNTSNNLSSLDPFSGTCIYCHLAVNGKLIKILSTLAPPAYSAQMTFPDHAPD